MEKPRHQRCRRSLILGIVAAWASGVAAVHADQPAASPQPLLRDGDRVVLLGDTFIEREGERGFVETALVTAHPEAALTIRNLGWSGDTVWAESRGVFDPPAKGYLRMLDLLRELAPTVVFIAYGRNESFRGEAGLADFRTQLVNLCNDIRRATAAETRLVLVTPARFETAAAEHRNALLAAYAEAIRDVAREKQAVVVDLFADLPPGTLTENGTHLSDAGYAQAAAIFAAAAGRPLPDDFSARSADLRRLVVEKNRLFFHRWRPANETYIFLFRKHEQGNNAAEIPRFDPLVEQAETRVRTAAKDLR
ncbi:MAG: SGNH/GDSL hydrolase family protein [Planctomycetia bacterium]|nr:SGNH/GDSL hydrolase family protein [Planctomycetia bacterium]